MKTEYLFSRHKLKNGLTLEIWNQSRPMAGDRWLVVVEARMAIQVEGANLPPEMQSREAEVVNLLGPEIYFSQKDERTFIASVDLTKVLKEMEARLLGLASSYLSHPEFSRRFIRKTYTEFQKKRRW